jgi:hypothetical protein
MKKNLLLLIVLIASFSKAQIIYPSQNINKVGFIDPNTNAAGFAGDGRKYSGAGVGTKVIKTKNTLFLELVMVLILLM